MGLLSKMYGMLNVHHPCPPMLLAHWPTSRLALMLLVRVVLAWFASDDKLLLISSSQLVHGTCSIVV